MNDYHFYPDSDAYRDMPVQRILRQALRTARRKTHDCGSCPKPIALGQAYRLTVLMDEGLFTVSKAHATYGPYGCSP